MAPMLLQDKKKIIQQVKKTLQPLANAQTLEWGFKIRYASPAAALAWTVPNAPNALSSSQHRFV